MQHTMATRHLCWLLAALIFLTSAASERPLSHNDLNFLQTLRLAERSGEQPLCSGPKARSPTKWWKAEIGHNGTTPYSADGRYQYYKTARQYGADNTGVVDAS